jgi:hypothetical protein
MAVLEPISGQTPAATSPEASASCFQGSFADLKERQLVFLLVRQLGHAQFERGDRRSSERLWQEVAALEIDPERITSLLYGGHDLNNDASLEVIDRAYRLERQQQPSGGWQRGWWLGGRQPNAFKPRQSGGVRRTARPTTPRARQGAC